MQKTKSFERCHFKAEIFQEIITLVSEGVPKGVEFNPRFTSLEIFHDGARWNHDSLVEFVSDYRKSSSNSTFTCFADYYDKDNERIPLNFSVVFLGYSLETKVSVESVSKGLIESVFELFETRAESAYIPEPQVESKPVKPIVFIGHGRGVAWRDLKDHLHDQHGYEVEAYETGARAGHTIRDILDDMASKSSFALLVMTGDDFVSSEVSRARQNIVHETGLFQGRLGFHRAIVLLENGVEEFSNLYGIQQLRFSKNNIKETFGDVLATLKREFG